MRSGVSPRNRWLAAWPLGVAMVVTILAGSSDELAARPWAGLVPVLEQGRRATSARPYEDSGVIRGQVRAADSGMPLPGALVVASSAALEARRTVNTDASGWFEFRGLPPGRFILTASRTGYATMQFGAQDDQLEGIPVDIGGASFTAAHFQLPRGGVVSGRITDRYGDPAIDTPVAIARVRDDSDQRRIVTVRSGRTDDLGHYRLWGLVSGEYVVVSNPTLRDVMTSVGDVTGQRTYYPGVPSLERAAAVRVRAGEESRSADFSVESVRHAVLIVRVTDSMKNPARQTQLSISEIQPETGTASSGPVVTTDAEGKAVVPRVVPGLYRIAAATRPAGGSSEVGTADVVVDSVDTECWIQLSSAALIRGRVSVAPGLLPPNLGGLAIRTPGVDAIDLPPQSPEDVRHGLIRSNGTFEVAVFGGRRFIQVSGLPPGWAVASVQVGREEWMGRPLEVTAGAVVENVQVVLTNQLHRVSGITVDADGNRSPGARVVLFPRDSSLWFPENGLIVSERANQGGEFRIRGVRQGAYWIAAVPQMDRLDITDRRYLEALVERAAPLTVDSGRDGLRVIVHSERTRH